MPKAKAGVGENLSASGVPNAQSVENKGLAPEFAFFSPCKFCRVGKICMAQPVKFAHLAGFRLGFALPGGIHSRSVYPHPLEPTRFSRRVLRHAVTPAGLS